MQENLRIDFWKGDITAFKETQDNSIVKYWQGLLSAIVKQ